MTVYLIAILEFGNSSTLKSEGEEVEAAFIHNLPAATEGHRSVGSLRFVDILIKDGGIIRKRATHKLEYHSPS